MKETNDKSPKSRESAESSQPTQQGSGMGQGEAQASQGVRSGSGQTQPPHSQSTPGLRNGGEHQQAAPGQGMYTASGQRGQQSEQLTQANGGQGQRSRGLMRRDFFAPSMWMENPFAMMRRLSEEMDRIFDEFGMGRGLWGSRSGREREEREMWAPQVEAYEKDNQLVICADLPGLKKDDVQIEVNDDVLTIRGERRQEFEDKQEGHHRSERRYGSFYRAIPLPEGIDTEQAKASFEDGVLKIMLPLPQQQSQRGRRIEIQTGEPQQIGGQPSRGQAKPAESSSMHSGA